MKYYTNPLVVRSLHVFDYGQYYGYRFARKQSGKVFMWWMRGVCERQWSTLWLLWVRPSASRESDRSKFQHYKHYTRWANYPTKKKNLWNDVSLGWIPDPKGDYTRFSNSLLAEFYPCFWATCPLKENFRLEFIKERKRQSFLYYFHKSSSGRKIPASDLSSKRTRFDNNFL